MKNRHSVLSLLLPWLLCAVCVVSFSGKAVAQHFEWAKGFGGSTGNNTGCLIKGSVTDDEGNLYILGQFNVNDTWSDGTRLLPMAPYGYGPMTLNALIAKISPSGEMLWKKVIHCNNGQNVIIHDIKKMGDTAFACLLNVSLPSRDNYCYYLDTLLPTYSDYPLPLSPDTSYTLFTTFILFGFDGEVKEQHFLQYSLVDTAGNDAVINLSNDLSVARKRPLYYASLDIDSEGNIYLARRTDDHQPGISVTDGSVLGAKFWVDNHCVGMTYTHGKRSFFDPQILKFSPHFNTLLADRYVVQSGLDDSISHTYVTSNLRVDNYNNVYYLNTLDMGHSDSTTLVIDSLQGISFFIDSIVNEKGFLCKFDSDLTPQWVISLDDSVLDRTHSSTTIYHDIAFDNDSNLFFLYLSTGRGSFLDTTHFSSVLSYQGTPLNLKHDAFFMSFFNGDNQPVLHSYGRVQALMYSDGNSYSKGNLLACLNNRVFIQSCNVGGIRYPDRNIRYPNTSAWGIGVTMFDYWGNVIDGQDYNSISPNNKPGPISLQDSVLYLMQVLTTDATFGDIHLPVNERMASIVKYVDTSFMTPYVAPDPNAGTASPDDETAFSLYPNPATHQLQVDSRGEAVTSVTAVNLHGQSVPLAVKGNHVDVGSLAPGLYILEITTTNHKSHLKFVKP